jgi:hypothetical protein
MRSFERRLEKLDDAIELVRAGRGEELTRRQRRLGETPDFFETRTADEDMDEAEDREPSEQFDLRFASAIVEATVDQGEPFFRKYIRTSVGRKSGVRL